MKKTTIHVKYRYVVLLFATALASGFVSSVLAESKPDPRESGAIVRAATNEKATARTAWSPITFTGAMNGIDVDGDGAFDALTDGVLVIRYLFGLRGNSLIQGAIAASAVRATAADIERYMGILTNGGTTGAVLELGCLISAVPASSAAFPLQPGTQVTLTPSCIGQTEPLIYAWRFWGIELIQSAITVAPSQTTTYVASPSNGSGTGHPIYRTVYAGPPPLPPGDCSIKVLPSGPVPASTSSAVYAYSPIDLTVSCASGGPIGSCLWDNGITSTA